MVSIEPRVEYARTTDGVTIAFTANGVGPPLVLLPGVPFSNFRDEWAVPELRAAYERLAGRFRLIQYDGRGTGHSQRDVSDFSLDRMLGDLEAVIDQAGVMSASVFGFFNSCPLAIAFAARRPDRVTRAALYGGVARGWSPMSSQETQALLSLIEQSWELFSETAAHTWIGWAAGESGSAAAKAFRDGVTPAVARSTLQAVSAMDVSDLVAIVDRPVLVLFKSGLRQLDEREVTELAGQFRDGHLVVLPGTSPALFFEDGDRVVDILASFFLGEHVPAATDASLPPAPLTRREADVLRLIAAGETNDETARRLGISVHTVERHAANLYRKIDARGRADATAWALRHGLG